MGVVDVDVVGHCLYRLMEVFGRAMLSSLLTLFLSEGSQCVAVERWKDKVVDVQYYEVMSRYYVCIMTLSCRSET